MPIMEYGGILTDFRGGTFKSMRSGGHLCPGTCSNHRVLANDSNQFVVFPSRERRTDATAVMSRNNFPSEVEGGGPRGEGLFD